MLKCYCLVYGIIYNLYIANLQRLCFYRSAYVGIYSINILPSLRFKTKCGCVVHARNYICRRQLTSEYLACSNCLFRIKRYKFIVRKMGYVNFLCRIILSQLLPQFVRIHSAFLGLLPYLVDGICVECIAKVGIVKRLT